MSGISRSQSTPLLRSLSGVLKGANSTLSSYCSVAEEIDFNILKCNKSYWRKVLVILFIYSTLYFHKWQLFNHHLPLMQQLLSRLLAPVPDKRLRPSWMITTADIACPGRRGPISSPGLPMIRGLLSIKLSIVSATMQSILSDMILSMISF